ncbi:MULTISPECIES: Hsp20/alpha crystallin family protein [Enterococcus]|uniref:Hsp20-like protein n=1 Tax=Candidatus Enterococcus ferrettii TaxID=2815324 RepID=A0ABV0EMW0_9ENTE|nr:Hsp20/alpha crystallin family protein [Enterococcus sp. 665A]MBO1339003.1 Hsp20/alpha crystallin family protein [Enterococcus sp. 665A]
MAGLFPRKDWLDGEELVGRLLNSFGDDRKLNVDVKEFPERYEVTADLPGFTKEEITVEYDSEILAISAEHSISKEEDTGRYLRKERSTTALRRQFVVKNVAEDQIAAAFENGVLTLTLPKIEADRPPRKKIDIQ